MHIIFAFNIPKQRPQGNSHFCASRGQPPGKVFPLILPMVHFLISVEESAGKSFLYNLNDKKIQDNQYVGYKLDKLTMLK